ncbi:hypothetical protein PPERSA_05201 [Pseudocohnilembus persalinus]|uniref:Uncharacterized protein n=1 Tax=Pseudocohnilembus persalinus TaxID=266149 RepID=A0A0V0R9B7_PSEPJ|nr:hypothetical protein PPERSA_05201 [Pseudocohnilembus persalinus]|eukprot:KRX11092.1 hypothetical protein PPERSA_05201 [Pseudocohnilembus persalinus]
MQNEINCVINSYELKIIEVQRCITEKQKNIQQNNLQEQLQNINSDEFYSEEYFENLKLKLGEEIQKNQLQLNKQISQENNNTQNQNLQDKQDLQLQANNGKKNQDNQYNTNNNNDSKNKLQQELNSPNQSKKSQQEILKQIANLPFNFQVDDELTEQLNLLEYQQYMEKQQYIQQIHQSQAKKKALPFEFAPLIQGQNQQEDQNYQQYMEQNQKKLRNNLNDPSSLVGQNGSNKLSQQQQVQQNQQNNGDSQYQQKKQLPFSFQPVE